MCNRKQILTIIPVFLWFAAFSQGKEAYNWYFGEYAGISFMSGVAEPLTDGALDQNEGCATISDSEGNLLFYTDGMQVWNKNHQIMQNGTGLMGNPSATQSGIIVPQPDSETIYYIFTVPAELGDAGLRYSVVDMNLSSGLGAVTSEKNVYLTGPIEEKVTAILHKNKRDIWVITHLWNSDNIYAYLVSPSGLNPNPVVSSTGYMRSGQTNQCSGCIKASPDGSSLVIMNRMVGGFDLIDFDNETGIVSNLKHSPFFDDSPYGAEFSPDKTKLYVSVYGDTHGIFQFEIPNENDPIQEGILVGTVNQIHVGTLQIGPDEKIYLAKHSNFIGSYYLGVIHNPNQIGMACNYVDDGFYLGGRKSIWGLPTFIQSYFNPSTFTFENSCFGDATQFTINDLSSIQSVLWNFGDPASGSNNTSSGFSPSHVFSSPGTYTVTVQMTYPSGVEESTEDVTILPLPQPDIGDSYELCSNQTLVLEPGSGFASYLWQDGSTNQTFTVTESGNYTVEVTTVNGCSNSDEATVTIIDNPISYTITGGGDYCEGEENIEIGLESSQIDVHYDLFRNGISLGMITNGTGSEISFGMVTQSGTYTAKAYTDQLNCESDMAGEAVVEIVSLPVAFSISKGGAICEGENGIDITLGNSELGITYKLFQNGIYTGNSKIGNGNALNFGTFVVAGEYTIEADNQGCLIWMNGLCTIEVYEKPKPNRIFRHL